VRKLFPILISLLLLLPVIALNAQEKPGTKLSTEELERYKAQVNDLVHYFEGTLNFIGDPKAVTKEKEIIINESYLKIFKDDKVQVEDDLDEGREVPLHKDVQAYLKDIEFFFRTVEFKFIVSDITFNTNAENLNYFKVTLNRDLQGVTVDGDSVSNRKVRFMEVNLDIASNDLRIASLYTTKLNEREEMRNWWNGLTDAWRDYFGSQVTVYDTLRLSEIYFIADSLVLVSGESAQVVSDSSGSFDVSLPPERQQLITAHHLDSLYVNTGELYNKLSGLLKRTSVDISGNQQIKNLEPLSELSDLTDLNCSNTVVINLFPVRNLNRLEVLDVSNAPVDDLSALSYSTSLKSLDCSYTLLVDLTAISGLYNLEKLACAGLRINSAEFTRGMPSLQDLNLSETQIYNLSDLSGLKSLEELDVSGTGIQELEPVKEFTSLKYLNAEETSISRLDPLSGLQQLAVLKISYTAVEDLQPLNDLPNLKRIYWDSNGNFTVDKKKKRQQAITFMNTHPGSLVIFESEELMSSWSDLEEPWKEIARNAVDLSENPTKEELHALLQLEEIRIENTPVTTLDPVARLYNLKKLSIPGLQVNDYSPVGGAIELEYLDLSNTSVGALDFVIHLNHLTELNIEGTKVSDLSPLENLETLKYVYADGTSVDDADVIALREKNPACVVLYKTDELTGWWQSLPDPWKSYFVAGFTLHSPPAKEQLHQLFYLEMLEIDNNPDINTYEPVSQLVNLKVIKFNELGNGDLQHLSGLSRLRELYCTTMPVVDLTPISRLEKLEVLNIENTPVDDLKPLSPLKNLRKINLSGTQVKSLKNLGGLTKLEVVELNNTQVKNISSLYDLPALQEISCFNTRVSSKNIEKFKEEKPRCKVVYY
jgi:hypothetical protein